MTDSSDPLTTPGQALDCVTVIDTERNRGLDHVLRTLEFSPGSTAPVADDLCSLLNITSAQTRTYDQYHWFPETRLHFPLSSIYNINRGTVSDGKFNRMSKTVSMPHVSSSTEARAKPALKFKQVGVICLFSTFP